MATQVETEIETTRAMEETTLRTMSARMDIKPVEKPTFTSLSKEIKELVIEKVWTYHMHGMAQSGN